MELKCQHFGKPCVRTKWMICKSSLKKVNFRKKFKGDKVILNVAVEQIIVGSLCDTNISRQETADCCYPYKVK